MVTTSGPDNVLSLESLASLHFRDLMTAAEIALLRAAPLGNIARCAPKAEIGTRTKTLSKSDEWGEERRVRSALIRWLCVDPHARALVDPLGIQVWDAKLPESLDLSFITVPFPLAFINCQIGEGINLLEARVPDLNLTGSWIGSIEASGAHVRGGVYLRGDFRASGEVRLLGAKIDGDLDCRNGVFINRGHPAAPSVGKAISADGIVVQRGVYFNRGFKADGEVRLLNARIGGSLNCNGGEFRNPSGGVEEAGFALAADGVVVGGDVSLGDGFTAEGQVRLLGAQIGGNLDCSNGKIVNPLPAGGPGRGKTLVADGAVVRGCIFLNDGFYSDGDTELIGIRVEKNLECINSTFRGALHARGAWIEGGFHWLRINSPELSEVLLDDVSASRLLDDVESWPPPGKLDLDGFIYRRIAEGPRDVKRRLEWISLQTDFTPQPYRQLAQVLREEGHSTGSQQVLFEMERRRRERDDRNWFARVLSFIFRNTVGYGYYPTTRAAVWLVAMAVSGFLLFWAGYRAGSVVPSDKDAYSTFEAKHQLPSYYERFHASIYSLENTFQLVRLGQTDRWQPDPDPHGLKRDNQNWALRTGHEFISASFLQWFRWFQIVLGWFFTAMLVAGVAGIVRKE
jgi:hypothetical protein